MAANISELIGKPVRIEWANEPDDDSWPAFTVDAIDVQMRALKLTGRTCEAGRHGGDSFWVPFEKIANIGIDTAPDGYKAGGA